MLLHSFHYSILIIAAMLDFDNVIQIIHTEAYIGQSKVKSAAAACRAYVIFFICFIGGIITAF